MKQRSMFHAVALMLLVACPLTAKAGSIASSDAWETVRSQAAPDLQRAHYYGYYRPYWGYYRPHYYGGYYRPYYGYYNYPYYGYGHSYYGRQYYYGPRYYHYW